MSNTANTADLKANIPGLIDSLPSQKSLTKTCPTHANDGSRYWSWFGLDGIMTDNGHEWRIRSRQELFGVKCHFRLVDELRKSGADPCLVTDK